MHKWMEIFKSLDENEDGFIDPSEFENLVSTYSRKYPQLLQYAKNAKQLFDEADANKDGKLSLDEFKTILAKVDSNITSLPSSAQSAVQQGSYLASSLNKVLREKEVKKLFEELDEDKSGLLDADEIKKGLKKLGLPFSKVT